MEPNAVQRVCPHCARISYADGRECPYCGRSFRRPGLWAIAAMLAVFAAVVLGGTALMFVAFTGYARIATTFDAWSLYRVIFQALIGPRLWTRASKKTVPGALR